jgi:error-prone DNA polymerase
VEEIHADFVRRARDQGLTPEEAETIWKEVSSFASFGFCKAHAAAFAVPTYQSAYLKAHYPAQFLAGVLTHEPGMYPRRLFLEEARLHGIPVLPLDVNESEEDYVVEPVEETYGIRLALKDVHGISADERRSILEARADRRFATVEDFNRRTRVSQPVLERIAHAGGFDLLRRERTKTSRRDRLFEAMAAEPSREGDQLALAVHEPVETSLRDYNDAERVRAELEVLGVDGPGT